MSDEGRDPDGAVAPDEGWRAYRCPVCSHAESAHLAEGGTQRLPCSHCGTLLEVVGRGPGSADVRVAGEPGRDAE